MTYTVKKLAELSGVSIRTLHYYDEIGLLHPAYIGEQGYRYYQEAQLLLLQQILFYRELGLELKDISRILEQSDFDKVQALIEHRKALVARKSRTDELIKTIDITIKKLKGDKTMNDKEIFKGFAPEKQAEHEAYLVNRYGETAKQLIAESKRRTKDWTPEEWQEVGRDWDEICADLASMKASGKSEDCDEVLGIVKRHFAFINKFWSPNKNSYIGLGQTYCELHYQKAFERFDPNHPQLAQFLAKAMAVYAEKYLK